MFVEEACGSNDKANKRGNCRMGAGILMAKSNEVAKLPQSSNFTAEETIRRTPKLRPGTCS